jgi:hypothetical protein
MPAALPLSEHRDVDQPRRSSQQGMIGDATLRAMVVPSMREAKAGREGS